jgi:predicted metal-dependent RNase
MTENVVKKLRRTPSSIIVTHVENHIIIEVARVEAPEYRLQMVIITNNNHKALRIWLVFRRQFPLQFPHIER